MQPSLVHVDLSKAGVTLDAGLQKKASSHLYEMLNTPHIEKDMMGWVTLPSELLAQKNEGELYSQILKEANRLAACCDYIVCIGIGGSFLGAKSVIDALSNPFTGQIRGHKGPQLLFAGYSLSTAYHQALIDFLEEKSFGIVAISKSGTTIEPSLCFRILRERLLQRYDEETAKQRICIITDPLQGGLHDLARAHGYPLLPVPNNTGGRFSVLSAVGVLPMALAGVDTHALLLGAEAMRLELLQACQEETLPNAVAYALARYALYQQQGKKIELLTTFETELHCVQLWWQQLFAESEGKEKKGLYPAMALCSQDLHSTGQWIQEGDPCLFETFLTVRTPVANKLPAAGSSPLGDKLDLLMDKTLDQVNKAAEKGTLQAHHQGGIPIITLTIDEINEYTLGALLYFFEMAVAISAKLLAVNPFDQPGVEAYKHYMLQHLGHLHEDKL